MRLAYLFLPRFPIQRRVLEQPSLQGRPLLLFADEKGAQRVRFASGSALKRGVRPGMTVSASTALEPSVVRHRFEPTAEVRALASLGETLLTLSPGFQLDAPEGLWLDASAAKLFHDEHAWAERVVSAVRGLGLHARCVVGEERFTTRAVARWARPGDAGQTAVLPRFGGERIASLPLLALEEGWLGVGATAPFRALGLSTLGELASLPPPALAGRFGAMGNDVARLCRGDDDSRFVPDPLAEVLEEVVQLDWPAEALEPVLFALKTCVDRICSRLQGRRLAAVRVLVTVGLESGTPLPVPIVLARASSEGKLLTELIRHRLTDLTVQQPITSLQLLVEEASADHGRQLLLGDAPAGEVELEVVMSRLQSALGEDALFSAEAVPTHRPEDGWATVAPLPAAAPPTPPRPSAPPGNEHALSSAPPPARAPKGKVKRWPKRKAKVEQHGALSLPTLAHRPPRLFREPARLDAELSGDGALVSVVLAGRRRKVELLVGPERLVGAWWSPQPFTRDYYRLQLEGVGQLWVYRDGADGAFYAQGVFD
ncbi:MAG: DNA polymerase Y family protein [Myxococcaceae bacterium]